jgi:hypothetical protein
LAGHPERGVPAADTARSGPDAGPDAGPEAGPEAGPDAGHRVRR